MVNITKLIADDYSHGLIEFKCETIDDIRKIGNIIDVIAFNMRFANIPEKNRNIEMQDTLLNLSDLLRILKAKRSTLYNWINEGLFPKGIKIGRAVRWHREDIEQWIEQKRKESKEV